jgi:enterochelin esterase-like enzyme
MGHRDWGMARLLLLLFLLWGLVGCGHSQPERMVLPTLAVAIPLPPTPPVTPAEAVDDGVIETAVSATPSPTTQAPTPTPCAAPGQIERHTFHSATSGGPTAYQIYLPPCYGLPVDGGENGRTYPTLYLLPGNIHDERIWAELGIGQAADEAIRQRAIPPLLIVMPDGGWLANNTSGGPGSYESLILNELIPHIEQTYCAWPTAEGRAIGGLSRGGYWALGIAFRHPQQFASVGGHSAALLDTHAGPDVNPQYTGLNNNLGNLRIYLDIGANDYVIHNIRRLHQDMEAAGVTHTWVLNEGHHEESYWETHLSDYLSWYTAPWPHDPESFPPCTP